MEHYNAFISYKHAPEDNAVAEAIHKGLERFHIPKKIREKTGMKKINRIFRDKDELPITSDLSDTIANALSDSDYLIVICSENTKDSAWVPREIEYFLKNHSKKEVFTVLVNGEPIDVIPEILRYDEVIKKDEDGNETVVKIPVEPLSCDYRLPLSKAKKTELPRLASGIIGCAYDELMNRHRQYRLKQLVAAFSIAFAVMLAFCGYMLYSRNRIHKSYLESLENQSRYLANESGNLLEKEQRITALQLALEALPKDEKDDRPVTAQALRALTNATLAYESSNGNNINAAWNYEMPNVVRDFEISPDGKTIAICDEGNVVGAWDTKDHKEILLSKDGYAPVKGIKFIDDEKLLIWSEDKMDCYDVTTGDTIWEQTLDDSHFDSKNNLMICDDHIHIFTIEMKLLNIDAGSGKITEELSLSGNPDMEMLGLTESKISDDGKKIAFRAIEGWEKYAYGVIDLESKQILKSECEGEMVKNIEWVGKDTFMVASNPTGMDTSMSFGTKETISTDHVTIRCIDALDMEEKWNTDFTCNGVMIRSGFTGLKDDKVAYFSGNVVTVYDIESGEEEYSNNVNSSVIDVSDIDGDGEPLYITENGGYAGPALNIDSDAAYYDKHFTDELRQASISNGVYVRKQYGHEVIYYGVHVYDENWKELCDEAEIPEYVTGHYLNDDCLILLSDNGENAMLDIFVLGDEISHMNTELEGESTRSYRILGTLDGKVLLGFDDEGRYDIISVDMGTKETTESDLFVYAGSFERSCVLRDNKLIYILLTEDYKTGVCIKNLNDDDDYNTVILPEEVGYIKSAPVYYAGINAVCIHGDNDCIVNIDGLNTADIKTPDTWNETMLFSDNTSGEMFALSDGKSIVLSDKKGNIGTLITCPGVTPLGMTFEEDELFVVYNDGSLYRYLSKTGELIKKSDISAYHNYTGDATFEFDRENSLLYIQMDDLTDVIDTKSYEEIAHITYCYGHNSGRDIFITSSQETGKEAKVGYFKRYSVGELIDKAHAILNGAELSEQERSRYGIE